MIELNKPYNNLENMHANADFEHILRVASGLKPGLVIPWNEGYLKVAEAYGLEVRSEVDLRSLKGHYEYIEINKESSYLYEYFISRKNRPPTYLSLPRTFESFYDEDHVNSIAEYFGEIEPILEERTKSLYTFVKNLVVADAGIFLDLFPRLDYELEHHNDKNLERKEVLILQGLLEGYDIHETHRFFKNWFNIRKKSSTD